MATMKDIRAGLDVLAKYVDADEHCVDAQHDVLYAAPGENTLSPEDQETMKAAGWHWEKGCKSWARFT